MGGAYHAKQNTTKKFTNNIYIRVAGRWHIGDGFGHTICGRLVPKPCWRQIVAPERGTFCESCLRGAPEDA